MMALAKKVKKILNSDSKIVIVPYDKAYKTSNFVDIRCRIPSVEKTKRVLGWSAKYELDYIIHDIVCDQYPDFVFD